MGRMKREKRVGLLRLFVWGAMGYRFERIRSIKKEY